MDKYEQLNRRIEELEKKLVSLETSSGVPDSFVRALVGRGFIKTGAMGKPPGDWDLNEGFIVATSPNAQAPATQYLRIIDGNGINWFIALYNFSELA